MQHVEANWKCDMRTRYLDLSLILYHFDGHHIDSVDWSHTQSVGTEHMGAVRHSSDIYHTRSSDSVGQEISQIADIDLKKLVSDFKPLLLLRLSPLLSASPDFHCRDFHLVHSVLRY